MNSSQIHLALTHLPVVLSLAGMIILIVSYFNKNQTVRKVGFYVLIFAGLSALPVFFSGEGAEELVEEIPGVSEPLIEQHEDVAMYSLYAVLAAGLLSLISLFRFSFQKLGSSVRVLALALSVIATGLMIQTAHLGGQIRHSEIREGALASAEINGSAENGDNSTANEDNEEEEDD